MPKHWTKSAPDYLVRAYQNRKIGNGRAILERLLRDERMQSAWAELARHVRTDQQWMRVWSAIAYAKLKSNQATRLHKRRSEERDEYRTLAGKFATLAKKIENGPLDVLTYELWGHEDLAALHIRNDLAALRAADLYEMAEERRCEVAHQILPHWPGAADFLRGLEKCALTLADNAMNKPRPDERSSDNVAARVFVWHLGERFRDIFGKAMLGTLAKIADVTFNRVEMDQQFSKGFVQNVLLGIVKRGVKISR
jgi:hypothetical protein